MRSFVKNRMISKCHPEIKHKGGGLCISCYYKAYRVKNPLPKRIKKVRQIIMAKCHPERRRNGVNGLCSLCYQKEYLKRCKKENPEKMKLDERKRQLKFQYGISVEEYDLMAKEQENVCLICYTISNKRLSVDHCHSTGKIRGLLCQRCNLLVGGIEKHLTNIDLDHLLANISVYIKEKCYSFNDKNCSKTLEK